MNELDSLRQEAETLKNAIRVRNTTFNKWLIFVVCPHMMRRLNMPYLYYFNTRSLLIYALNKYYHIACRSEKSVPDKLENSY